MSPLQNDMTLPTVIKLFILAATILTLAMLFHPGAIAETTQDTTVTPSTRCANLLSITPAGTIGLGFPPKGVKQIEVSSNDNKERKLSVDLGDLALKNTSGAPVATTEVIEIQPKQLLLKAGRGQQVAFTIKQTPLLRPGIYVGSLLLTMDNDSEPKGCLTRLSVQLTVPDAEPLSEKISLRYYRPLPLPLAFSRLSCVWQDCVIPLQGHFTTLADAKPYDAPLGVVQNERGNTAIIYRAQEIPTTKNGVIELPFTVAGRAFAGKYEGQVRVAPTNEKPNTLLSLVVTDWFVWPIGLLAVCMWVGLLVQRYVSRERALWGLRKQEAELGGAFQESQRKFTEEAKGNSFAGYSIAKDFAGLREALRKKLDALRTPTAPTTGGLDPDSKSVVDTLESLRTQATAWGEFAGDLQALQVALGSESDLGAPPPTLDKKVPALFQSYGTFLVGSQITVAKFEQRRAEVREATQGAQLWYALKARIDRGERRHTVLLQFASSMSPEDPAKLTSASVGLRESRLALWDASDIAELNAVSQDLGALDTAETALRQLAAKYGDGPPADGASVAVASALTTGGDIGKMPSAFGLGLHTEPVDDAKRVRFYDAAMDRWDRLMTLLAFVIASLTWASTNYIDKPFGTLKDYVLLVLWGFGTKMVVDTAGVALGSLFKGMGFNRPRVMIQ